MRTRQQRSEEPENSEADNLRTRQQRSGQPENSEAENIDNFTTTLLILTPELSVKNDSLLTKISP
jgi:hypothetical protein